MSQLDELRKKASELVDLGHSFAKSYKQKTLERINELFGAKDPISRLKLIAAGALVCIAAGFIVGIALTKAKSASGFQGEGAGRLPILRAFLGKKFAFTGLQPDGSFVFSNFEKPENLAAWSFVDAHLVPSTQYAWEGSFSGKLTFSRGKELSAITIDELGRGKDNPSDWSKYGALQFFVFHPGNQTELLTLMVTDLWGKRYEESISVPKGIWAKIALPMNKMASAINVQKINQISISKRGVTESLDFYIDDFRLVPSTTSFGTFTRENIFDYGFAKRKPAWLIQDQQINSEAVHVPFIVTNETSAFCQLCPVEGGIPFPMGELRDPDTIRIRNPYGEELPFQTRVLAHWPDRSVKWLGIHFETSLGPREGGGFFLDYSDKIRKFDFATTLKSKETNESIEIETGVMKAILNKKSFFLFDQVFVDQNGNNLFEPGELMTSRALLTLQFRNKEFRADLDTKTYKLEIEEKGPQKLVLKARSWLQAGDGERFGQLVVRYYFYSGKSYVKIAHTLIYTGYPENRQYAPYQIANLSANEAVESFGIRIPFQFSASGEEQVYLGLAEQHPFQIKMGEELAIVQKDYDSADLRRDREKIQLPDHFAGWFDVSNLSNGIAVSLRHFRENYPKAFSINRLKGGVEIDLWPKEAGVLDLSTTEKAVGPDDYGRGSAFGLAKTHDLLIYFHKGDQAQSNALNLAGGFLEPLLIRSNPYWVDATGALGRLLPADPKYGTLEKMLERLFNWAERQPRNFKWYGMLDFGDTLTWWRNEEEDGQTYPEMGWHPVGRWGWYNCEGVGTHTGALLQFARTGHWKYFEFGENLAKHIMDIDTVHYDTVKEKRLKNVINERYSWVGSMHRHSGDHWSGRTDEASHTNVLGLLIYYYLTGNERAFDVVKEVGEYFLREPFTYVDRPDLAPNRAMANALWGDVLLYQATWEDRYKKAAEKIIKIFLKGQQPDGSFLENYNALTRTWAGAKHELYMGGYIVGAFMAYHELTQDEAVKEMFLKLVRYLAPLEFTGPTILHGIGYAYLITQDPFFIYAAEENLKRLMDHQQFSRDPLLDGLIYDKPIYHRPMAMLSTVPYVFGALEEHFARQNENLRPKP
ncbi:MAG: glycoside hydrolase family 127 protein [Candidatus Omnitrophica bacterium]|nr:glycoside hydrolase family 127 protein [Candidatus Omnitrophota bacterium]